ncbi:MAG: adenosylmethionine--8-amino-7-oxononanoate transaminase [Rhodopirellula sp.]|nr:adenosylmethionine--8-amino-7-oxononanoate transaminase [Rhodopirellula sp.]|tara:strand:- start:4412 stop:5767 length:1356 start_codon:yes stop_codon:yes gene_type:complete
MTSQDKFSDAQQLADWDREHVWHAFTQMQDYEPLIVTHASGCVLTDIEGRELIDGVSSVWCNVHGHQHPIIDSAIREQLNKVAHVTSLGMSNPTTIELARRLAEITPDGLEHTFFSGDGASSVEVALKMAFQYWHQREDPRPQKNTYIALGSAYHGDTLGSVSVGGVARFHEMFEPLLFNVIRVDNPNTYRLPEGVSATDATAYYLDKLESTLATHHQQVAAMVIEPLVQGAAGLIMQPEGYLRGVRELTRKYDVLLIADEVAVGFGRTGKMFACEHESVSPDIMCLAKGLTGGYLAMSATIATTEIWNAFLGSGLKTFYHGHTYAGNPLAAAAALATLDIFHDEATLENVATRSHELREALETRIASHPLVGNIRQRGLIAAIELVADKATKDPLNATLGTGYKVCQAALDKGVWLRPLRDTLVIMPPLSINQQQLQQIVDAVDYGLNQL